MSSIKRIDSYGKDIMIKIIYDILKSDWPAEFKKHILLKELLWKVDSPKGVRGDNSKIIFSSAAMRLWKENEKSEIKPKNGIIIEHAVPRLAIYTVLSQQKKITKTKIVEILENMIIRVAVTKAEDDRLNKLKLRQKMPEDWDGFDLMARHRAAKIKHVKWIPEKYKS